MNLLLDAHAFLWFIMGDARLSSVARAATEDPATTKFVSAATAWEIAIKGSLGKLTLAEPFEVLIPREMTRNGFGLLPIELAHLARLTALPFHHRDPFDRLVIAQAMAEKLALVTVDTALAAYGVAVVW